MSDSLGHTRHQKLLHDVFYAALFYQDVGLRILPLRSRDKRPYGAEWASYRDNAMDSAELASMFSIGGCNLGIITGPESGITVIDADNRYAQNEIEKFVPQSTPIVKTPRGAHFYFRHDGERNGISISWKRADDTTVAFDVRGEGGFVVAPPSTVNGRPYRWIRPFRGLQALPAVPKRIKDLIELQNATKSKLPDYKPAFLARDVGAGKRNHYMTTLVGHLVSHSVDQDIVDLAARAINEYSLKPPLSEKEVLQVVESILKRDKKNKGG